MIFGLFACLETLMVRDGAEWEAWAQLSIPVPEVPGSPSVQLEQDPALLV